MIKHDIEYLKDIIKIEALRKNARVSRRTIDRVFFIGTAKNPIINLRLAKELRKIATSLDTIRARLTNKFRDVPEDERAKFIKHTKPIVMDIYRLIERLEDSAKIEEI